MTIRMSLVAATMASALMTGAAFAQDAEQAAATSENSSVSERENKFKPIVMPFYDPSIEAGIMAVPLWAFYPDDNDLVSDASTIALPLIYTSNESYIAKVAADIILFEDKLRFVGEAGQVSTNLTMLDDVDTNKEEWSFEGDAFVRMFEDFYVGLGVNWVRSRYTADNAAEQARLTAAGFSDEYEDDLGIRIGFQWDTREHYYYPHSGFVWDMKYETHAEWLGNDDDKSYSSLFTDYRYFHALKGDSNRMLATRFVGRYLFDAETAPSSAFTTYGRQGKEVQRGFVSGDYIAANMVNLETEYRHSLSGTGNKWLDKSTLVGIAGIGKSFGTQLDRSEEKFNDSDWLGVIGVGYRYNVLPYERINLKVDVTYNSDGEVIAYFGVGESI